MSHGVGRVARVARPGTAEGRSTGIRTRTLRLAKVLLCCRTDRTREVNEWRELVRCSLYPRTLPTEAVPAKTKASSTGVREEWSVGVRCTSYGTHRTVRFWRTAASLFHGDRNIFTQKSGQDKENCSIKTVFLYCKDAPDWWITPMQQGNSIYSNLPILIGRWRKSALQFSNNVPFTDSKVENAVMGSHGAPDRVMLRG